MLRLPVPLFGIGFALRSNDTAEDASLLSKWYKWYAVVFLSDPKANRFLFVL